MLRLNGNHSHLNPANGDTGVDVILDNVGAPYLQRNLDSLNIGGRLFIIGFQGGTVTQVNLSCLLAKRLTLQGIEIAYLKLFVESLPSFFPFLFRTCFHDSAKSYFLKKGSIKKRVRWFQFLVMGGL